jgi:hypothetical protein
MHDHDHDDEPSENFSSAPLPFAQTPDLSFPDETPPPRPKTQKFPTGMLFGAFAGLLLGAVAAGACCWVVDENEFLWHGALVGAVIGPVGAAAIGVRERKARGDFVRPDIATITGVIYGLFPALLILFGGSGGIRGRFSGVLLLGAGCAGPMAGLLIGALLDRAYEASRGKLWRPALGFGLVSFAACIGILVLMARAAAGPDPDELAAAARSIILWEWRKDPDLQDAKIRKITLAHDHGKVYSGSFDAKIDGQVARFKLTVFVQGGDIEVRWLPMD